MPTLATWNVNSLRARKQRFIDWLAEDQPDVVCLQELKMPTEVFLADTEIAASLKAGGYQAVVLGQKTYNGVAIVSRLPMEESKLGLPTFKDDPQARFVETSIAGVGVVSVYVPNGSTPQSDKFAYKLAWLDALLDYLKTHHRADKPLIVAGDFNIAPSAHDVCDAAEWQDTVLCCDAVRERFEALQALGFYDIFNLQHPKGELYSWWDYRKLAFEKDDGLRIDLIMVTKPLLEHVDAAWIERAQRCGASPSDHAPVVVRWDRWPA